MGDETQVTWKVQLSPLVMSEDHIQTSRGAQIMIPSTVKDVSINLVYMPLIFSYDDGEWHDVEGNIVEVDHPEVVYNYSVPAQEVSYQVPIVDSFETDNKGIPYLIDNDTYRLSSFVKNPYGSLSEVEDSVTTYGVEPSTFENQPDWDFYQVGLNEMGIYTFEVTGTVESVGEDTYIPIRADNTLWKCHKEGGGPGSAEEGCAPLKRNYDWARSGELPPVTTAEQSEDTRNKIIDLYKKQGTADGLTGVGTCAVTQNTDRFDIIDTDIEAAAPGKYGAYQEVFGLALNPAINYWGPLLDAEDNCDQGFQHITLCPDEESEVPPSEEPTPVTEKEEVDPAKPSKDTEEPTSSDEPQESEEPTSSKKSQEPGEPISSEEPVSSESKFVPSAQSEQDKPADSKPESKPAPKTVISESVKDNVAKQAKTVAKKDRPKVTTGGHLRAA
ncbi:hypothetical protein EML15_02640 [Corynebacterium sp. sy017]|uniref:hypothetical protein n=1 Tax=unclassified Corynebacterium TaxID=2624378 RepID=UPI0011871380|nr:MULTISPECIES: hypothetical protein [unclassified Corynebacterium]MBP3088052.1 hypothetical protein [Corynebacterium sp. sy017]TSD92580.1 hypothetical protein ELY17_02640 [Corynebacterium sp. SY003]